MSFPTEAGAMTAWIHRADVQPEAAMKSGARAVFVAPGARTAGRFGLFRFEMPPRSGGPAAHYHRTFSESFYVLSGLVRLYDGTGWATAGPGDYLYVPDGGVHAFGNESEEAASMLILFAPGTPRERYFLELAEVAASGRVLSPEEWTDLYARHDQFMV